MKNHAYKLLGGIFLTLILVSCNLETPSDLPTVVPPTPVPPPTIPPPLPPTHNPFPDPILKIVGDEEIVFDWTNDRCADHNIPDLAFRAFRGADGQVQAILSSDNNYRMLGPDLNNLKVDCDPIMTSEYDPDPSRYTDAQWVAAPYTEDGETVYALVHNEYQGHSHPGQCPQNDYFPCWDNSITLAISTDGGKTYEDVLAPPQHLIGRFPYPYKPGAGPEGFRAPSNIIKGIDDYYYSFFNVSEFGTQEQWVCLMRTDDLSAPDSWRFWDGTDFAGQFADPYVDEVSNPDAHICPHIDQVGNTSESLSESITYNTYLERYVLVGVSADWLDDREIWGFYYSFSDNLINWTHRKLLLEIELPWTVEFPGSNVSHLYPSLLDPESSSRNFETTDKTAYLYFTRNNFGHASLDRDLIRIPVEFYPDLASAPEDPSLTSAELSPSFENSIGTWVATDVDGSNLAITVTKFSDSGYSINYHDDGTSSCSEDTNAKPPPAEGVGTGTTSTTKLIVQLEVTCLTPSPSSLGIFELQFTYRSSSDTITDNWGVSWQRDK